MPRSPRKTINLPESNNHLLNMYALAAGAAGVGMLALAPPAGAKIVYTPAHRDLTVNKHFYLDLNHDRINDFEFYLASHICTSKCRGNFLRVKGLRPGDGIWSSVEQVYGVSRRCAVALTKGRQIGSKAPFHQRSISMFSSRTSFASGFYYCPWLNQKQAYLGLKFSVSGKVHFGWARFTTKSGYPPSAQLTGYAYETIPGKPIIAGATKGPDDAEPTALNTNATEPATLGMLALGAPGLSIWRREESVLASV
jgi:hypothetical protein